MTKKIRQRIDCRPIELDGLRYVILRESVFEYICERAGLAGGAAAADDRRATPGLDLDGPSLAEKLVRRRRAAGLSQAELARRAGVRAETLNRIERGRTTPDFATVRKLVLAIAAAERRQLQATISEPK